MILVIAGLVAAWLIYTTQRDAAVTVAQGVTTAPAERADIDAIISATGSLMPERSLSLAFGTGGRVAEVLAAEGDMVTEGQTLAPTVGYAPLPAELQAKAIAQLDMIG